MDLINSILVLIGAAFAALNVVELVRSKRLTGASAVPVGYFAAFNLWMGAYLLSLGQPLGAAASLLLASVNLTWLGLLHYYRRTYT